MLLNASTEDSTEGPVQTASWGGVLALSLGAFALVASEFMPVSLLTPVAADLHVTEGAAGQAISVSAAFAVLTSLFLSSLAGRTDRKWLLLGLTGLMILSGTCVALAPNFTVFMIGRALIGVAIGGFWSLSAATTMKLVPTEKVPHGMAILNGGNALATVIAAPLGSFVGGLVGWRGAFFCLVPVALIVLIWQLFALPSMKPREAQSVKVLFRLLSRPVILLGMVAVSTFFMGQFALFTYLRPFLEAVTKVDVLTLSTLLLMIGIMGAIGTAFIGGFVEADIYKVLTSIPFLMALVAAGLIAFGTSFPITTGLLALWGLLGTSAPVGWWSWIARTAPQEAEAGGGLMVAVIQLAIGFGATLGGVLFDMAGYHATFGLSAGVLLVGGLLAFGTARRA